MKFEVEFCSTQQYLPSQRHKKLRCRCENHFFDVEVSEVRNDEFPVAFIVSSEGNGRSEIRIRDKNLYQKVIRGQKTLSEMVNHKLTNIDSPSNYLMRKLAALGKLESDFTENSVIVADDAEEQKRLICEQAKDYIIFKGNLWERCDEPGYYVTLFPYGSIHFGIAVDSRFRSGRFFNAFEKSKVIAFAKQILQESIDKLDYVDRDDKYDKYLEERASCCEIQVLMPEMVTKCHEFLSKQDFLQKCKSIVRGEITEIEGVFGKVSVKPRQLFLYVLAENGEQQIEPVVNWFQSIVIVNADDHYQIERLKGNRGEIYLVDNVDQLSVKKGAELFRYFSNRGKECQVICTAQESLADVKAFLPNEIWFIAKRNDETILNNSVRY